MGLPEAVMWIIISVMFNTTLLIIAKYGLDAYRAIDHDRQETARQREFSRQIYLDGLSGVRHQNALHEARQEVREIV